VIGVAGNIRVYLACGVTDMRKGFDGLAARVERMLRLDPHSGALFVFRGRRGDLIKVLWWDGQGLCLFAKRLKRPAATAWRRKRPSHQASEAYRAAAPATSIAM
jgi:transposase